MADEASATTTLLSGGGLIFVTLILQYMATFLAYVAIGRILGSTGFGVVSVGATLLTFATTFVLLGLDSALGRYLPRDDDTQFRRDIAVSALQIIIPLTIVTTAVMITFDAAIARAFLGSKKSQEVVLMFALALPFAVVMKYSVGVLQGLKRSSPKALIENLVFPLSRFGLVALALFVGAGAVGVAGAYTAAYALAALLSVGYLLRNTTVLHPTVAGSGKHRELLEFSSPLMIAASMLLIHRNIDVLILGYLTEPSIVGIYSVVYILGALLLTGYRAISFIFMPVFSETHADGNRNLMRETLQLSQKWALFVSLPIFYAFAFMPSLSIGLTFGAEYVSGSLALIIVALGFMTQSVVGLNGYALNALGKTRVVMWDTVATAGTNLILNLLLVPIYAEVGAAIATAASFLVLNVLYTYQLYAETGIWPLSRGTIRIATIATAIAAALVAITRFTVGLDLAIAVVLMSVYGVMYAGIIGRYGGITDAEFAYIETMEHRFGLDLGPLRRLFKKLQA